jgi:dihydropyrimidinase
MRTLVGGGRIITATDDFIGDVVIEDGRIAAVGVELDVTADRTIDARERYVFPGGVDPHTHMSMPFGGTMTIDDFTSGTRSAACGGTTAIVDFCLQEHGQTLADALATWHAKLEATPPVIDVGFHIGITDLTVPRALDDLAGMPKRGVTSFKCFMAYKNTLMVDDETLFRVMQVAAATRSLVMVHAENGGVIDVLVREALADGHTEPRWHAATRPMITEGEATERAICLADIAGCTLYVVHVSCEAALEPIARARGRGQQVLAETCPQYLFCDETDLARPDFEGAKYVFTPPARPKEQQEHLWQALRTGVLDVVSTDHCPFNWQGQKTLGRSDFSKIPNGAPGIEHRLALLHHFGVNHGRLTLNQLVDLTATAPARQFGLLPRKGTISPGADGDLVIFNPERTQRLSVRTHHSKVDYNLYEGFEVTGAVEQVLLRGELVVADGEPVAASPAGQFIARAPVGATLAAQAAVGFPE